MPRLLYVGPFRDGVEIPALDITATPGVPFDVPDEGNAAALLAQATNFVLADDDTPARAADDLPAIAGEED